jgi:hypothetical protein
MKTKILVLVFALILMTGNIFSQTIDVIRYFPMRVGNFWVYDYNEWFYPVYLNGKVKYEITGTKTVNGKSYYVFSVQSSPYLNNVNMFGGDTLRVDSISGNLCFLYRPSGCSYSPDELCFDSLSAKPGDTVSTQCGVNHYLCLDTLKVIEFDSLRSSKSFYVDIFEQTYFRRYIKNIGLDTSRNAWSTSSWNYFLRGCRIDGIVYGDTSYPTGIIPISSEIPSYYNLYQNYPNPFNPFTKIKFDIAKSLPVTLTVYNTLGKNITVLVNERLNPGTYEIEFDGGNFPSGIYFYTLTADEYEQTRKMVLIK